MSGLTLRKFVVDVCVCMFCFMFVQGLVLWIDVREGLYVGEVLKCDFFLMTEFECPEMSLTLS